MENEKRLEGRTDVLGQYVPPIYIKVEDFEENKQKIDYSQSYVLPTIKTRYISFLIDLISVFLISVGLSKLLSLIISLSFENYGDGTVATYERGYDKSDVDKSYFLTPLRDHYQELIRDSQAIVKMCQQRYSFTYIRER